MTIEPLGGDPVLRVPVVLGVGEAARKVVLRARIERDAARGTPQVIQAREQQRLWHEAAFLLGAAPFPDLDTAAAAVADWAMTPPVRGQGRQQTDAVRVELQIEGGGACASAQRTALPTVEVEHKAWGTVDVVHVNAVAGVYRLNLAPGGTIPNHEHRVMNEAELVLHDGLVGWQDDGPEAALPAGTVRVWRQGQPHGYRNDGERTASILCVDCPPFLPEDEVEVDR